ncbi:hypothetical protein [Glycomyces xiaoerkulensis]|uniref:hypothetical protein n=1 Tax=Glycomyces xiaoerkulensis TaxID=2038139 RepID=UPI000C25A6EC|nr:hypothetical protein [Glycomyces xiaoerkulensis]
MPPSAPEEEPTDESDPRQQSPAPPPGDYADLTAAAPPPEPPGPGPETAASEVPHQSEWGGGESSGALWPPPENQDWISQQARTGGWTAQGASWPPPNTGLGEPPPEPDPGRPYAPDAFPPEQQYEDAGPPAGGLQPGAFPQQRQPEPPAPAAPPEPPAPPRQEPPEPAAQTEKKVTTPPTHAGVRYAIYGIGGVITLGLIIAIVIMLGGPPASEPSGGNDQAEPDAPGEENAAEDEFTPERYAELAGAVGTAEWFAWRHGEAGGNGADEELPALEGGSPEPLFGAADRTVQGQLAYVTEQDGLSGVDHVTVVEANDEVIDVGPRAGGRFSEDGTPELELEEGSTAECIADQGGDLGAPVALARPEHGSEVNAHAVIAFSGGLLATTGISGAQGGTCLPLPDGHVPTDLALTDGNELALVTTWSPESQTGSLVVVALADQSGHYRSSWSEPYPGLPNTGAFGTAEILGQVELPFTAPTSVDAWSNSAGSLTLSRATLADEPHADTVATAGYALVGSQPEQQATVVDLAPALTGLADRHYEGAEFELDAAAAEPADLGAEVTDVAADGEALAVATRDGVVHHLDRELAETAAVEVGENPTCLKPAQQSGGFVATSRGDATVRWIADGAVTSELSDARLSDPVCARETPNLDVADYGGNAVALLVSDYSGQALHSYLVGSALPAGGGSLGEEGITYAGAYEVAGMPFDASVTVDLE